MEITTFAQIDGAAVRSIRQDLGRTQEQFWAEIGIKRDTGNNYERRGSLPGPIQRLVFMRYIAGIDVNSSDSLLALGRMASATFSAHRNIQAAVEHVRAASLQITAAEKAVVHFIEENHNG